MTVANLPNLPSPVERLQREAEKAHKAQAQAHVEMLEAHTELLKRPSIGRQRALDLARLSYSRARRAWIKAEDKLREAQGG